ncbi:MAG: hypothetical protein JZU63_00265 [Rhodoferax sp.]|nr:hypothetical protein [Rhodoferax sp.]
MFGPTITGGGDDARTRPVVLGQDCVDAASFPSAGVAEIAVNQDDDFGSGALGEQGKTKNEQQWNESAHGFLPDGGLKMDGRRWCLLQMGAKKRG